MRGIRNAIALLKQTDAGTALTYGFIRKLCDCGQIKSVQAGRKILINFDELLNFLSKEAN
jgi:excisionase family DNA binding protein